MEYSSLFDESYSPDTKKSEHLTHHQDFINVSQETTTHASTQITTTEVSGTASATVTKTTTSTKVSRTTKHVNLKTVKEKSTFLPPCRVCNGPASGFHYGVNTCEACKTFFRRTLIPEASMKPCKKDKKCFEKHPKGKIPCASCRYQKCLLVGMDKDGIKKGRYTYEKRLKDLEEATHQKGMATSKTSLAELFAHNELQEGICISLQQAFESFFPETVIFKTKKVKQISSIVQTFFQDASGRGKITSYVCHSSVTVKTSSESSFTELNHVNKLMDDREKQNLSVSMEAKRNIWISWANEAQKLVSKCCNFMKKIPDFNRLPIDDRMTLVKSSFIELLVFTQYDFWRIELEAYVQYDSATDDTHFIPFYYLSEAIFGEEFLRVCLSCVKRLQNMELCMEELALLAGILLLCPDREGLQDTGKVEQLQSKLVEALRFSITKNHPAQRTMYGECLMIVPTLRECNILHYRYVITVIEELDIKRQLPPLIVDMILNNQS